jgi:hypothetical protein
VRETNGNGSRRNISGEKTKLTVDVERRTKHERKHQKERGTIVRG